MTSASRPPATTMRAPLSVGGVDVGIRIPLCEYGLVRRIPVTVRRLNQSWTTGMKGVVPFRKMIQSGAARAPGSEGMIPLRRVNQSCAAKWGRKCEDPILIGLPSRPESRCPERDAAERTRMPSDASEIGARKGRNKRAEMEAFPSPHGFWTWQDRHHWNRVANFIPPWHGCRDWSTLIVVAFEQSDLVSSLLYNPFHLFSLLPDLAVTNLLRWKGATLLYRLKSSWETQELRTPRGSDHIPVSPWTIVNTTILLELPFTGTRLLSAPLTSSPMGDMGPRARFCIVLMGLAITSSAHRVHRSATLGSLMGFLSTIAADRSALQNGYGTVEARYHLTAYDCSDPSEVQAYSSIPASHCSTRSTPVKRDRPTRFQLLQKERKRYINAYVC